MAVLEVLHHGRHLGQVHSGQRLLAERIQHGTTRTDYTPNCISSVSTSSGEDEGVHGQSASGDAHGHICRVQRKQHRGGLTRSGAQTQLQDNTIL